MRCVFYIEDYELQLTDEVKVYHERSCGRPGVGMFEQKPYCADHMKEVEEHYWAQHRNDQASQAD